MTKKQKSMLYQLPSILKFLFVQTTVEPVFLTSSKTRIGRMKLFIFNKMDVQTKTKAAIIAIR